LVHDDLPCMDDDALRRGRPTTHRAFDVRAATVAGAFMIPLAVTQLLRGAEALGLAGPTRAALVRELTRAAGARGMVGGQWLDLAGEGEAASRDGLEAIHRLKTGALMEASLAIGAIAADVEPGVVAAFREAGAALGLAFQIHDDVLDETASDAVLGKTAGKDRSSGKTTFPAVHGLDGARAGAAAAVERAHAALRGVGIEDAMLHGLIAFAVDRDR
ncbi:MAG: polyprenyl synthetase family protein, partial [Longimicrobiales bacterium]